MDDSLQQNYGDVMDGARYRHLMEFREFWWGIPVNSGDSAFNSDF